MIQPAFEILNQRGTPMFFSDVLANRPTAGIIGRIFIATDSPYGIFRDTGSGWDQIAGSGGGGGITGSGAAGQVTFWTGASAVSGSNNLFFDNASGKFLVGTNNTAGVGQLQVTSASGDSHARIWGTTSPSIRIDNAVTGATQRFVMGLSTATNNFIQGSAAGDICISTASANPLLFGMWQTSNASEVMRISTANNLLIGTTTDAGQKLQVTGNGAIFTGGIEDLSGEQIGLKLVTSTNNKSAVICEINNTFTTTGRKYQIRSMDDGSLDIINRTAAIRGLVLTRDNRMSLLSNTLIGGSQLTVNGHTCITAGLQVQGSFLSPAGVGLELEWSGSESFISSFNRTAGTWQPLRFRVSQIDFALNNTNVSRFFSTGNLGIGTTTDAGFKLDVQGTSRYNLAGTGGSLNGFLVYNASTNYLRILGNGEIRIGGSTFEAPIFQAFGNSATVDVTGANIGFSSVSNNSQTTSSGGFFNVTGLTNTIASGHYNNSLFIRTFAPTSGTATFTNLHLRQTINQTGGANGITRGLHIQPTLTAAADFRSFEFDNSTGWGIYGVGSAPNYLNGNLNIASTSNPGQKLYVNGSVRIDGQTSATAGGSAGLHLILNLDGTNYKIALLNV